VLSWQGPDGRTHGPSYTGLEGKWCGVCDLALVAEISRLMSNRLYVIFDRTPVLRNCA